MASLSTICRIVLKSCSSAKFSSGKRIPRCARCSTKTLGCEPCQRFTHGLAPTSHRGNNSRIFNFVPGDHAPETMSLRNRSAATQIAAKVPIRLASSTSLGIIMFASKHFIDIFVSCRYFIASSHL
jgi:hypothetical protein